MSLMPGVDPLLLQTRRQFFQDCGIGIGSIALASLLEGNTFGAPPAASGPDYLRPKPTHFAPRAKRIIFLFMNGAPSQLDLFENKPKLAQLNGKDCPDEYFKGERFAFIRGTPKLLGSP